MKKIISKKGIILIIIPAFAIFLQFFLRIIMKKDFNTIGISLGGLSLGQLLPFFHFDHFISSKVLGINPHYKFEHGKFIISYDTSANVKPEEIESIKNIFIIAIFINLALFLIIIYLGLTNHIILHTLFGLISCVVSWYLLIYK
ncbi:hypothetical protein [Mucilaginibacter phyllosphaerae]|uniref:Uncharacterized protein n=1 Tax=Mucilaginibacter phyllosphaerae TaxID=1812349 RepID=A0A4Y8ACL0_9SPHI|nr:hypothetical protein [Mucilaginibacter phyllosphaerae]MBB3970018.1 hypothetical protein [Mucilaginibacter phyllosphaerae]TEW66414.1 hypothetical protein E2R65_08260 [Mucilaginibacter phyllosphaerae]GGH09172.1 hypothetical protein GCM10007352_14510 [Mucilaginibacter phyllosphaerae]